ncbi:hypothetical protein JCM31826_02390 [Thermaurantimonas aggregans]|uniref:Type 1 periplasmic binding fold superfamily protein n=1 Tax=Thermaurantimonas aggregans TaxID=2173829 RepID=A0A401XIA3_9FLAO|nr:hypothetical protein [Thermaurantimonas aggregans]MCX8149065.1 hypothetical protein [Thermaurantimonas aggregans]GCD76757.1 hypothetical protein JCM31826_02390 [Thermaurantimonas aggregans]
MSYSAKLLLAISLTILLSNACKKEKPEVPKENELITTLEFLLKNSENPADSVVLRFFDLDGMGGIPPQVSQVGEIKANQAYRGSLNLWDETQTPPGNVNVEILATAKDHQFFYIPEEIEAQFIYKDFDPNGKPLGLLVDVITGNPSSGSLRIVLRHYPDKNAPDVAQGNIENAGGSTDIEAVFPIEIKP